MANAGATAATRYLAELRSALTALAAERYRLAHGSVILLVGGSWYRFDRRAGVFCYGTLWRHRTVPRNAVKAAGVLKEGPQRWRRRWPGSLISRCR